MQVLPLPDLEQDSILRTDLLIIGGGPAGLSIAQSLIGTRAQVIIAESGGVNDDEAHGRLNTVEILADTWSESEAARRRKFHGSQAKTCDMTSQRFGVRCRGLGGSTAAWAGKSAAFDDIDFEAREWVPNSGWPIARGTLDRYIDEAAAFLNLGPDYRGEDFWKSIGAKAPSPAPDPAMLPSFFWQFARSRVEAMDILRVGPEFLLQEAENIRVILDATATDILTDLSNRRAMGAVVSSLGGRRATINAKAVVVAASAIENARLLLASTSASPGGLGNQHDVVGRYLMDHAGAQLASFRMQDIHRVQGPFGFFGARHAGRVHMYNRGLAPSRDVQRSEKMLNCALYVTTERSPDDPWDALKRLLRGRSRLLSSDALAVVKSPGLLAKGIGRKMFQSQLFPELARSIIIEQLIRLNPGFVVEEFQTGGLPHKVTAFGVSGIAEQPPKPENRVTLSTARDALGVPLPLVRWRFGAEPRLTLLKLARLMHDEFVKVGLPEPVLEPWVAHARPEEAVVIDMAHTAGTTRMSASPRHGVVDADCMVHGMDGLFVAGGSVFPTIGHANPTLMIVAVALRLADHLKTRLAP